MFRIFLQVSLIHCLQGQVEDDGGDAFGGTSLQVARGAKIYTNCANGWIWLSPRIFISCYLRISFQFVGKVVLNVFHAHLIASCPLLRVTSKGLPQSSQQRPRHPNCLPPGNSHSSRGRKMLEQICVEICISLDDSMHAHVLAWDYSIFTHLRDAHM